MRKDCMFASVVLFGFLAAAALAEVTTSPGASVPGAVFSDCSICPEMVVVPKGTFQMGDNDHRRERPEHTVTIDYLFAAGKYEVTFDEWDACLQDGGCNNYRPGDAGWGRGRRPVINVSVDDAHAYVFWLSKKTGKNYRLLSEAEWEYIARAGSTTIFWWGNESGSGHANCNFCGSEWDKRQTAPVGSFPPNKFGICDTAGNLTEWVEDRWNANYEGAPADGRVWETGDPKRHVMRSGSWYNNDSYQRSAYRNGDSPAIRNTKIGFRVGRNL